MKVLSNKKKDPLSSEEWRSHIAAYDKRGINQAAYCREAGISYRGFKYWRGMLLEEKNSSAQEKFVSVKVEKTLPVLSESSPRAIQVKLVSGNVVYIPATLSMIDIGQLIRSLESVHA